MAKKENKPVGTVIKAEPTFHGRLAKLKRGGVEVDGVLLSRDKQGPSDNLAFQWTDKDGNKCINEVTKEELEKIKSGK
jgi:hypothetical protein